MTTDDIRGFTLLEILIVICILGVTSGLIFVNYAPSPDQNLQVEAHRVALLLDYAGDFARTSGKAVAWVPTAHGYRFLQAEPNQRNWKTILTDPALRARELPKDIVIKRTVIDGNFQVSNPMLIFSPAGLNPNFDVVMTYDHLQVIIHGDLLGKVLDQQVMKVAE